MGHLPETQGHKPLRKAVPVVGAGCSIRLHSQLMPAASFLLGQHFIALAMAVRASMTNQLVTYKVCDKRGEAGVTLVGRHAPLCGTRILSQIVRHTWRGMLRSQVSALQDGRLELG